MKKHLFLIISILTGLALIAGSYFWAIGIMDSIYAYRSQLKGNPPEAAALGTQPLSQRVVVVLIDGLRLDTSMKPEVMPNLNQLRERGAWSVMRSEDPSYSEPSYSTILTGAWPEINDGPVFNLDYAEIPTITQETIFTVAHRAGLRSAISAYYWFEKLIEPSQVDDSFFTEGDDQQADKDVMAAALAMLDAGQAKLVFIHLDQVDYAGHHEGGVNENWDAAAARCDEYVGQIMQKMDFSTDTLMVFSDHGHIGQGGHGGTEQEVKTEPFIVAGAGVIPGEYAPIEMVDLAPTVAALLGSDLPSSTQGQVLAHMLATDPEDGAKFVSAEDSQKSNLLSAYATAIGSGGQESDLKSTKGFEQFWEAFQNLRLTRLNAERLPRLILAGSLAAAMIAGVCVSWKKEMLWWILGALLYLILFNLVYLFGFNKTYSFSTVTGAMGLIISTAIMCAIALIPAWLFTVFVTRQFQKTRSEAVASTVSFLAVLICALLIPALLHFSVNGLTVTWTMPQWNILFLGLLSLIQILVVVVLGLILTGITSLIKPPAKK